MDTTPESDSFAGMLKSQGYQVDDHVTDWPLKWIVHRVQVSPYWPAVESFLDILARGGDCPPIIVCRKCFVVVDGWHRLTAYWLARRRTIPVRFTDSHFMALAKQDFCRIDEPPGVEYVRDWAAAGCISGSYRASDSAAGLFGQLYKALEEFGGHPTNMPSRLWERTRCVLYAVGWPPRKRVLDVGTRESTVPDYLRSKGSDVVAIDLHGGGPGSGIIEGDVRTLDFSDASFDAVLCTSVIKFVPEGGDTIGMREMLRVTRRGGYIGVSFDLGQQYAEYPSRLTGRRIYDVNAVMERLVNPVRDLGVLCGPVDFDRCDWTTSPLNQGNLQVAAIILRRN